MIVLACVISVVVGGISVFVALTLGRATKLNRMDCNKYECIYHPDNGGAGYLHYRGEE